MEMLPNDRLYVIYCPHTLQEYVGCNDESAKEIARLVYEIATDKSLIDDIADKDVFKFLAVLWPGPVRDLFMLLFKYDVYLLNSVDSALRMRRYERPASKLEMQIHELTERYVFNENHDEVELKLDVPDILCAYAEFAGLEVGQEMIDQCAGFYDANKVCSICREKFGTQ